MKKFWLALLCCLAASTASAQLQVYSARWETIGGGPGCDAKREMADACNGRNHCEMYVDPRYLCGGDPAPGRLKSLNIGYSCYGQPQPILAFRDGSEARLRCERGEGGSAVGVNAPPPPPHGGADRLQIYSARWEALDSGEGCDATRQLVQACDGKAFCQIFVDPRYLCHGDPAPGHEKRLDIRYACNGERQAPVGFPDFAEATLRCGKHGPVGNPPPVVANPPPVRPSANIHVNSARWEAVGGGGWCDALPQMAAACDGKRFCQVTVDPQYVCGKDPAPGRNKSLLINYACDGRQQAPIAYPDFANAVLRCDGRVTAQPPVPPRRQGVLAVQSARWEVIGGGGWCDATPQLAQACNGKTHCRIDVEPRNLCNGDPAPGQLKSLDVSYTCDGSPRGPIGFPDFAHAVLKCE